MTKTPIHRLVTRHGRVYDVFWDVESGDVSMKGLPWSLTDANVTVQVGRVASEAEAIGAAETAAYERLSTFSKYVGGTTMGKSEVIAVHLLVEHILIRCLHAILPDPAPLFRSRAPSFSLLVSLCEAHCVVSHKLAGILRALNSLRNKCAHSLTFDPSNEELDRIMTQLIELDGVDVEVSADDDPWPLLCELLERRASELGATDI